MIRLGITGGIGSGKSVVSRILEKLGIPVYIADDKAKQLMISHPAVRRDLVSLLGPSAYIGTELNKARIGEYLFAQPENTQRINAIVHPRVKEDLYGWFKLHQQHPILAMESAILFDAHFEDTVDFSILVYSPQDLRIKRVLNRDQTTPDLVQKQIHTQLPESKKLERADFLILNDTSSSLMEQVQSLIDHLLPSNP